MCSVLEIGRRLLLVLALLAGLAGAFGCEQEMEHGAIDGSTPPSDAGASSDGGTHGVDAAPSDAGPCPDAGPLDAGPFDAGPFDAGPFDAGPPPCGS